MLHELKATATSRPRNTLARIWGRGWCSLLGHEPIVEHKEAENKSVLECQRCGRFLEDFVLNLRQHRD